MGGEEILFMRWTVVCGEAFENEEGDDAANLNILIKIVPERKA